MGTAYVQSKSAQAFTVSFTNPNTAGNLLVVCTVGNATGVTCVDSRNGNVYSKAFAEASTGSEILNCFYFPNCAAGTNTVTITGGAFSRTIILEYSGVALTSPLDGTPNHLYGTSGLTPSSGNMSTNNANDLLLGFFGTSSTTTITAGTIGGATAALRENVTSFSAVQDNNSLANAAGNNASIFNSSSSVSCDLYIVAFTAAHSGGGIGTVLTSGAAIPATVTNTNGVSQLITTPTVTSKLGQPTAIVFCDPNGNEYAITGSTAGAELEGPTPVVLCTTQGKAIAPTYTLTSNGHSIVVTATLTGTKRGQPVPVCISDPNGFAYITTGFASVGNYVANPTPICLTDQNGNVLTLTIGN